jgi:RNase P subunit RPR2
MRPRFHCPHCKQPIAPRLIKSAAARINRSRQAPPVPKVLTPCPHCGQEKGARELRLHKPRCKKNPLVIARKAAAADEK